MLDIEPLTQSKFRSSHLQKCSTLLNFIALVHISGVFLSLFLLATPIAVSAHKGHGDEFHQNESAQSVDAIEVDAATAERIGLKVEPVKRQPLIFGVQATR